MTKTLPFAKEFCLTKTKKGKEKSDINIQQNQAIKTKTKTFDFKIMQEEVPESFIMQVQHQMVNISFTNQREVPATRKSELVPLMMIPTLEHAHPT